MNLQKEGWRNVIEGKGILYQLFFTIPNCMRRNLTLRVKKYLVFCCKYITFFCVSHYYPKINSNILHWCTQFCFSLAHKILFEPCDFIFFTFLAIISIIMINMPGKPPHDFFSRRPISLLPMIHNIFETLLLKILKPFVERKNYHQNSSLILRTNNLGLIRCIG